MSAPIPEKKGVLEKFTSWVADKFSSEPITVNLDPQNYIPNQGRGYFSGGRSSGSKYRGALSRSTEGLTFNHWSIRQNARDAVFDSPIANALVERSNDSIVDFGLKVEFTPKWRQLGITEQQAQEWADDHEERFDAYMNSKQAHKPESLTGYQIQRQIGRFTQRDNDWFVRFHYSQSRNLISPVQLSFIDPNQIRGDEFTSTYGQFPQDDGIERNEDGKEIGYNIWIIDKQKGGYKNVKVPALGTRSKRIMMIHGYDPLYAGQGRGISRLYNALTEFEKLTDFSLAKIMNAINQSNYTLYVKPSGDNPASDITEGMPEAGPRRGATDTGTTPSAATGDPVSFCSLPEATQDAPGSTGVFSLREGEDLKFLDHNIQGDGYDKFVNAFTSYLAASHGMPLEVLLMKFNQNYSASRAALILFWRWARIWRQEMDADLMTPWLNMWLAEEIAAGRTQAPGWSDPRLRAAWMAHNLIGSPMPSIDPGKDAKSDKDNLEIGITTQERLSRERFGMSARDNAGKNRVAFANTPVPSWGNTAAVEEQEDSEEEE